MKFLLSIIRKLLSLRYSIEVRGIEVLKNNNTKLFLPNHQAAVIDPLLLVSNVFKYAPVVPLVTDRYYDMPILKTIFKKLHAIRVSDIYKGSKDTNVLKSMHQQAKQALELGKNVIVYPAGQSTGQGYERIFNKQGAHLLVFEMQKNVDIIGVRIKGLWGSMWSRAWSGKSPSLIPRLLQGMGIVFLNLLIFLPKRKVSIEFVNISAKAQEKAQKSMQEFNGYLEEFYNRDGEELVNFEKHYFFKRKPKRSLPKLIEESEAALKDTKAFNASEIPLEIKEKIINLLANELQLPAKDITLNSHLNLKLGLDSLGLVTIVNQITQDYEVAFPDIAEIKTVADLCYLALGKNSAGVQELPPSTLHHSLLEKRPVSIGNPQNIPEKILELFASNKKETYGWDMKTGTLTRGEFLLKALVLAKLLKKEVKGTHIGIMLPALQSTNLVIAASYFANKIPVMFNWTVGKKTLMHCVNNVNVEVIITAEIFYQKVQEYIPTELVSKFLFLEKKLPSISLAMKLQGLLQYKLPKLFVNTKNVPDTAVILFTSGSENSPKTVALSHENIIADIRGVLNNLDIYNHTIFLNFLPPFHSFGFMVLNVFPLCTGIKLASTPDPTDTDTILQVLRHTKASFMAATPTFLKMILNKGFASDFKHLDFSISGAERLPAEVMQLYKEKTNGALLLEGYGITECSPIISFNPREKQVPNSVGKPIDGIDIKIVHIETHVELKTGEEGMILASGPSVFGGYLDADIESPFTEINGKTFYITGDLGYLNEEGYLFISGRLKRFLKVGGEMVSLPFVESVLMEKYGDEESYSIAVEGSDTDRVHKIALFTIKPLELAEINKFLLDNGVPAIAKITEIHTIDEIPLLGSGKIDYKVLKALV